MRQLKSGCVRIFVGSCVRQVSWATGTGVSTNKLSQSRCVGWSTVFVPLWLMQGAWYSFCALGVSKQIAALHVAESQKGRGGQGDITATQWWRVATSPAGTRTALVRTKQEASIVNMRSAAYMHLNETLISKEDKVLQEVASKEAQILVACIPCI